MQRFPRIFPTHNVPAAATYPSTYALPFKFLTQSAVLSTTFNAAPVWRPSRLHGDHGPGGLAREELDSPAFGNNLGQEWEDGHQPDVDQHRQSCHGYVARVSVNFSPRRHSIITDPTVQPCINSEALRIFHSPRLARPCVRNTFGTHVGPLGQRLRPAPFTILNTQF